MTTYAAADQTRRDILINIADAYDLDGIAPTVQELARTLYLGVTTVRHHLKTLEAQGLVKRWPGQRTLVLTDAGRKVVTL
jgi:DNA-binding MarR family transcriptional regulator